jgi:predicted kinase
VVIGGVPGAGKSTVATRLAADLGVPCLSTDSVGDTVRTSRGIRAGDAIDATWTAYDVVFQLCQEFTGAGVSVVLDMNLGWQFQWDWLDALRTRQPHVRVLPITLQCPRDVCLERIQQRHLNEPANAHADLFRRDPKILDVFAFVEQLKRPDSVPIDASRAADTVYSAVKQAVVEATLPGKVPDDWMPRERWMHSFAARVARCVSICSSRIESTRSASPLRISDSAAFGWQPIKPSPATVC